MYKITTYLLVITASVVLVACGGKKAEKSAVNDKKAQLEQLKKEQKSLNDKITALEAEIVKLDPSAAKGKTFLVSVESVGTDSFSHFIDLQGKIDAQNVGMVFPRGQGGVVRSVLVRPGQFVGKGQLVLTLDNAIAVQQVNAAKSQIPGIEAQVNLAKSVYEKQQNLWSNNIGTEVQVLQAKTNYENAVAQLQSVHANIRTLQEAASLNSVTAPISGTVDVVNTKVGDFFSPQSAAMPTSGIRIVNTSALKVMVNVPENYLDNVKNGSSLVVTLPEVNKTFTTRVNAAAKFIDPVSRTFGIEAPIPSDKDIKANQIAKVQIKDYGNNEAITIPIKILQSDETGKFVYVGVQENGKMVARRKTIIVGELYGDKIEVKSGLVIGDQIITEGFQSLYDGVTVSTAVQ